MLSPVSGDFLTYYDWFHTVLSTEDQPLILCHTSALECLGLFPGYGRETGIDVYATRKGKYNNVTYHIIDDFDKIETVKNDELICTSLSQTVNDMLAEYETMDYQALIEGLAAFYCRQGGKFDGLSIKPEYMEDFNFIREGAEQHFAY